MDVRAEKEYYRVSEVMHERCLYEYDWIHTKKSKRYTDGMVAIPYEDEALAENKNYQPAKMLNIEIDTYKTTKKWDMNYSNFLNFPQYVIEDGKLVKNKKYVKMVELFGELNDSGSMDDRFKRCYTASQICGEYDDSSKTHNRNRKDMYTMLTGKYWLACWEFSIIRTVCLQLCGVDDVSFVSEQRNHMEECAFMNGLLGLGACFDPDEQFKDRLMYVDGYLQ